jgi:hypothetical protein
VAANFQSQVGQLAVPDLNRLPADARVDPTQPIAFDASSQASVISNESSAAAFRAAMPLLLALLAALLTALAW